MVDARNKELEERKNKANNIVLFNVPEQSDSVPKTNKARDENVIRKISGALEVQDLAMLAHFRMGKKKADFTRPLVAVLGEKKQRKTLLEKARLIKNRMEEVLKRVVLTRDLTQEQRRERKEKLENREQTAKKVLAGPPHQTSPPTSGKLTQGASGRLMDGDCSASGPPVPQEGNPHRQITDSQDTYYHSNTNLAQDWNLTPNRPTNTGYRTSSGNPTEGTSGYLTVGDCSASGLPVPQVGNPH
ncbi:hypothetical protein KP79_PYT24532 [Mizuhopecten yessoensis]|uniref:Uncharacterized protein n=1 Tax=Mizuhopecten yessoensis TaxID=6573 RepID=A0A210Q281_MIZYE|nr:hypothetical protein KP79_PYT24532 [Mizuhopecten yessoensis]